MFQYEIRFSQRNTTMQDKNDAPTMRNPVNEDND